MKITRKRMRIHANGTTWSAAHCRGAPPSLLGTVAVPRVAPVPWRANPTHANNSALFPRYSVFFRCSRSVFIGGPVRSADNAEKAAEERRYTRIGQLGARRT